jgi:hypothetical protein
MNVTWRIVGMLFFLAFKELLQLLLYYNIECTSTNKVLSVLTWIHISFQPLFVLLFFSAFSKTPKQYNVPLVLAFIYAIFNCIRIKELRPGGIGYKCSILDKAISLCREQTCNYQGRYHIAYGFELASADGHEGILYVPSLFSYMLLSFAVPFAIGDWQVASMHALVAFASLRFASWDIGEASALWCLNSFWMGILAIYYAFKGNPF